MMYGELIKKLRTCEDDCSKCPMMYDEQVKQDLVREHCAAYEAADAIEELQRQIDGWIEQERKALLKSMPKWIPVTERCPEKSGDYLVFDDCRNLYVNEWHCLLKKWQYDDSRITHWMPLQEPPKEET